MNEQTGRLPTWCVVFGIAAAVMPVIFVIALGLELLQPSPSIANVARIWLTGLVFAMPLAGLVGVPLALWKLREARIGRLGWGLAGLGAGIVGGAAIALWFATATPLLSMPATLALGVAVLLGLSALAGTATALLARWIAWRLARRFG